MNLKNLLTSLLTLVLFTVLVSSSAFAQTYVSNTNGNDITGSGTALSPYKTITKGIASTSEGGSVVILADTYNETVPAITKSLTLISQSFSGLNTVTITNGLTVNGTGKTVNIGRTADGSVAFNLGATNTALILQDGSVNISQANVVIASGGRITRTAGTINEAPTTTNVDVVYNGTTSITAGAELPSSLGTGTLTVNLGAAATLLTVNGNLALSSGQIVVTQGSVAFNGTVSISSDAPNAAAIINNGAGTVTFVNAVSGARASAGALVTTAITNGAGVVTLTGGVSGTSTFAFGLTNGAGTINVGAGTYAGPIVNNTAAGTLNLLSSVTFSNASVSNGNATAVVKLNGFQISLTGTTTLTNTGNFISATASTVGSGMINISGVVTTTGSGELPNVTVASGGKLTLGANTAAYGDVTLNSAVAGAITDGGFNLSVYGAFNRIDNTPSNYTASGTLTFASATAQTFTPGASLVLNNLTVNKASSSVVTLTASVEVAGNLTITAGSLDVGNFYLNLSGASTFNNSGNSYSTTGVGYVVFKGASGTVTGTGTFGNILIQLSNAANSVVTGSNIAFNGTLYLYDGQLNVANGHTVTFADGSTIKIVTTAANAAGLTKVTAGGTGTVAYTGTVNLIYEGTSAYDVTTLALGANTGGLEWTVQPLKLNNVTINATNTVTGANAASTIAGTLTVAANAILAQGANVYTLSGDAKTHSILGSVTGGTLTVTGSSSQVNGTTSTAAGNTATVNSLAFEPAANSASFSSSNLKVISGDLTLQGTSTKTGATATVIMNPATSTLTGDVLVGNGTLGPNAVVTVAGTTTSVLGGDVTLTDGTLTLTRGGNSTVVGGAVTLTKGTLTLGSNVTVTGATTQAAGNLALGGNTYTQLGSAATPDFNRTGAGTVTNGIVAFDASAAPITVTVGATLVLPSVTFNGTANSVTFDNSFEISGSAIFDNAATVAMTAGTVTFSGNSVSVTNDAGAFTGAAAFTGSNPVLTLAQNYAFPTLTVNTAGTFTVAGSPAATARTLTAGTAFTLTQGTVALDIHSLSVATAFTQTAGTITQSTGYLNLNVALPVIAASGFSVDNLNINTTATSFGTSAFTVTKNLVLAQSLTTSADGKLTLGNGATIERQGNAYTLAKLPTFGTSTNVIYSTYAGAANITTGKELPATVNNLTVLSDAGALKTILAANVTVNGTLSLADMFDATTTASVAITMANNSTLELKVDGTSALDENLTKAGSMNLIYNGAANTTTRELGALSSGVYSAYAGNVTFKSTVTLDAPLTLNGTTTFDGGNFALAGNALNIGGNVVTASTGNFTNAGAAAFLSFTGATNTSFGLAAAWSVPATIKVRLNKTNNNGIVTLAGGNLDFATNSVALYFQKGSIATGDNIIIIKHTDNSGLPSQGFDRTGVTGSNQSHVIGNVQKLIDATGVAYAGTPSVALTRVEFPVGTENYYRPFALQFNTIPTANFTLTVSHDTTSPAGENGFPISATDALGNAMSITNYPDFYWLVKSSLTLQPAVKYDVEATAAGYTDYEQEGIQNIRFIRRFANNDNNPWVLQGGTSYDNSTNGTTPVVIVRDATGAISTQGARFTYSQTNLPPHFTAALTSQTVDEGDTLSFTYTAVDPDINQTATLSAVTLPTGATFNASTGAFKWIVGYTQAGTHTITIRATDGIENKDTTVTITVNNVNFAPVFSNPLVADTITHAETLTYDFNATDVDGQTVTFALVSVTPAFAGAAAVVPATGVLTFAPVYADAGKVFSVKVLATDGIDTTFNTAAITVVNGAIRGDADGNGSIQPADATRILNGVIGNPGFTTAVDSFRADASGNGFITSYDAYYVLYYIVNGSFPTVAKAAPAAGEVKFGDLRSNATDASVVTLPVKLNGTSGVNSALVELTIDEQYAEYKNVALNLPDGWYSATTYKNGKLLIALVGTSALKDGEIASVNLSLKNKEAKFEVNGNVTLNEDLAKTLASSTVKLIPSQFDLSQNYPNPFNPTTNIKYQLAADQKVSLVVYDMLGQKVASIVNGVQEAGYYTVQWNGTNDFGQRVSSGVYIFRLVAGDFVSVKKMNLLK